MGILKTTQEIVAPGADELAEGDVTGSVTDTVRSLPPFGFPGDDAVAEATDSEDELRAVQDTLIDFGSFGVAPMLGETQDSLFLPDRGDGGGQSPLESVREFLPTPGGVDREGGGISTALIALVGIAIAAIYALTQ